MNVLMSVTQSKFFIFSGTKESRTRRREREREKQGKSIGTEQNRQRHKTYHVSYIYYLMDRVLLDAAHETAHTVVNFQNRID